MGRRRYWPPKGTRSFNGTEAVNAAPERRLRRTPLHIIVQDLWTWRRFRLRGRQWFAYGALAAFLAAALLGLLVAIVAVSAMTNTGGHGPGISVQTAVIYLILGPIFGLTFGAPLGVLFTAFFLLVSMRLGYANLQVALAMTVLSFLLLVLVRGAPLDPITFLLILAAMIPTLLTWFILRAFFALGAPATDEQGLNPSRDDPAHH